MENILLIEPKEEDQEAMTKLLKMQGYKVFVAKNVNEALCLLKSSYSHEIKSVILSDETINQVHLNFINWLRENHPKMKLVVTSCRTSDEILVKEKGLPFVLKPIRNIATISQVLNA